MRWALLWSGLAVGCGGKEADDDSTAPTTTPPATLDRAEVITVTTPLIGDSSCFDPGGTWGAQTVDPTCQDLVDVTGDVEDFQSGDGVANAQIELFYADRLGETPDAVIVADVFGVVNGPAAYTCSAFTARITVPGDPPTTKTTVQQHWTENADTPMDTFFNSVSVSTALLMPAVLQLEPDPTRGVVAGTAYTCAGEGNLLENAQVIVRSVDGYYPAGQEIRYFFEEFPTNNQPATSADGLWIAINVPAGPHVVELWGVVGSGEPQLIAETPVDVVADGITVADIYLGDDDGVKFDAACLSACP